MRADVFAAGFLAEVLATFTVLTEAVLDADVFFTGAFLTALLFTAVAPVFAPDAVVLREAVLADAAFLSEASFTRTGFSPQISSSR